MPNKVKRKYLYLILIVLVVLVSVSTFYFFYRTKQDETVSIANIETQRIDFSQLDGYYLGFMKTADSNDMNQLVFLKIKKFYPKASQTPQANITYQTLGSLAEESISYDFLRNELSKKAPDKLLDHLAVFGQGPFYWSRIAEMSGENKVAAPLIYASKENNKLRLIISYSGSEEPDLSSFSLVKIDKNKMNDKGVSLIKQYLLNPQKDEKPLLNYYGMIEFNEAITMVGQGSFPYIGTNASPIFN
jgi:hypothetical protein